MAVGLPRFMFISPQQELLSDCQEVSKSWLRLDGYDRLLCVRSFSQFNRPYDAT